MYFYCVCHVLSIVDACCLCVCCLWHVMVFVHECMYVLFHKHRGSVSCHMAHFHRAVELYVCSVWSRVFVFVWVLCIIG